MFKRGTCFRPVIVARASQKCSHNFFGAPFGRARLRQHQPRKLVIKLRPTISSGVQSARGRFITVPPAGANSAFSDHLPGSAARMAGASPPAFLLGRGRLCHRCLRAQARGPAGSQWRPIHLSVLAKRQKAAKSWEEYSKQIEAGTKRNLWDILEERGYVKDVAG